MIDDRKPVLVRSDAGSTPPRHTESRDEAGKHDATIARLGQPHYASVIEVGCATGSLSARLWQRCDRFLGLELSDGALRVARKRMAQGSNVALRQVEVPRRWPRRKADLIVLSGVLSCLEEAGLRELARCVDRSLMSLGEVVIVCPSGDTGAPVPGIAAAQIVVHSLVGLRTAEVTEHPQAAGFVHYTLRCRGGRKARV